LRATAFRETLAAAMTEVATTVLGGVMGLVGGVVLSLLASRKRLEVEYDIELRKQRIEAYRALWKILEPLAYFSPASAVTYAAARDLSKALRSWYFEVGGLFLSEATRNAYFDLQKGLGNVAKQPPEDDSLPVGPQRFERLRGIASTLRTMTTEDVATRVTPRLRGPRKPRESGLEVTARRGRLWEEHERDCYSVLVKNPLSGTTVDVTRVYFQAPEPFSVLEQPIRLGPGGHWEIAVPADSIPTAPGDVDERVRVQLAGGTLIESTGGPDVEPHPDFLYTGSGETTAGGERVDRRQA
jgi:hypothetical protein